MSDSRHAHSKEVRERCGSCGVHLTSTCKACLPLPTCCLTTGSSANVNRYVHRSFLLLWAGCCEPHLQFFMALFAKPLRPAGLINDYRQQCTSHSRPAILFKALCIAFWSEAAWHFVARQAGKGSSAMPFSVSTSAILQRRPCLGWCTNSLCPMQHSNFPSVDIAQQNPFLTER